VSGATTAVPAPVAREANGRVAKFPASDNTKGVGPAIHPFSIAESSTPSIFLRYYIECGSSPAPWETSGLFLFIDFNYRFDTLHLRNKK